MNNLNVSQGALARAERWYQSAERALDDNRWDDVIYSCEMAVEQAIKGILILFGIEYPKKHDISEIYLSLKMEAIPKWFSDKITFHAKILKILIEKRSNAAYGYVEGKEITEFQDDANKYIKKAKEILKDCKNLIIDFESESKGNRNILLDNESNLWK